MSLPQGQSSSFLPLLFLAASSSLLVSQVWEVLRVPWLPSQMEAQRVTQRQFSGHVGDCATWTWPETTQAGQRDWRTCWTRPQRAPQESLPFRWHKREGFSILNLHVTLISGKNRADLFETYLPTMGTVSSGSSSLNNKRWVCIEYFDCSEPMAR